MFLVLVVYSPKLSVDLDLGKQEKSHVEAAFYCLTIIVKVLWKKLLVRNCKKAFWYTLSDNFSFHVF